MTENKRLLTVFARHQPTLETRELYQTLSSLSAEGVSVHCVCARELKLSPEAHVTQHLASMPKRIPQGLLFWLYFLPSASVQLFRVLRQVRPTAVLVLRSQYAFAAFPVCALFRKRITLLLTMLPSEERRLTVRSSIRRKVLALIDRLGIYAASTILVPTTELREQLVRAFPSTARKIEVSAPSVMLPESVKQDEFGRIELESWREWLSRFQERKHEVAEKYQLPEKWIFVAVPAELAGRRNVDIVVRALSSLDNERLALFLWGGSIEKDYVQAMAVSLGLYDQLTLVDSEEDFAALASGCDLCIQPSNRSGSSRLVLEALGLGIATIAAETPEVSEILIRKELLFRPSHVQALVEKLHSILNSRGELAQLRKSSQERAIELGADFGFRLTRRLFG